MLLGVLAALAALLLLALDSRLRVRFYTVEAEVASPVRLAVIADLHSCAYGENQEELLEAVRAQRPDGVLFVGDIVDDVLPRENAYLVLETLAREFPCAYVTGNHEYWTGQADAICRDIADMGVAVLRGGQVRWQLEGQEIVLCGVDDADSGELEEQLSGLSVREKDVTVLLARRPEEIAAYTELPFDLVISGHAHGGQWRLPGLINGLYAPNQGWFPAYAGGLYQMGDTAFVVSRGLARESTRIPRIFNPPELVVVTLAPESGTE